MRILAIETSCDDTSVALLEASGTLEAPHFKVLSHVTQSQIELHRPYGGVYPNLAKREHARNLVPVLETVLTESSSITPASGTDKFLTTLRLHLKRIPKLLSREPELAQAISDFIPRIQKPKSIDTIAVTVGPGLEPALWVGINFARTLGTLWNLPVIPVNHMEGHIVSTLLASEGSPKLAQVEFPALSLLVSGGHTELVRIGGWGNYTILGKTVDDAVGEAFDKIARILKLPYPGGPEISKLAQEFRASGREQHVTLPRPMLHSPDLNFSFSGLKTAVLYYTQKKGLIDHEHTKAICAEVEESITEVLVSKTEAALRAGNARTLIIGGGVSANTYLREKLVALTDELDVRLLLPEKTLSTDNAIMIGIAGYFSLLQNRKSGVDRALGNLSLEHIKTL
jgi:N6-L-threonylcarbamoyladenine synthase